MMINPTSSRTKTTKKTQTIFDLLKKDISFFSKAALSDQKKERFYSKFSLLFSSGLDVKTVFDLMESEEEKEQMKELVSQIKSSLIKGQSLSETMEETGCFSTFEIFSIKIGEDSGKLLQVLIDLAEFYSKKIKQRRQIVQALSYPIIVLTTVAGVLTFMLKVMVPMFSEMFKRFNGELPFITKVVITGSESFGKALPYLLVIFAGLFIILYVKRNDDKFRKIASKLILKTPMIGPLVQKIYLGRFCHSMHLLLSSRLPLVTALDHTSNMISFYPIETATRNISIKITKGESFKKSLADHAIFEKKVDFTGSCG